ncbi:trichothecene c-15 hydroxylase [Seiridium cupressi]
MLQSQSFQPVAYGLYLAVCSILIYFVGTIVYNGFFHPLRNIPGPRLWAVCRIPYTCMYLSGSAHKHVLDLHKLYGDIVRLAPEIVSINHPDAMKELRGHRKAGVPENGKDPIHSGANLQNIIGANRNDHARFRRLMSNGFSAQAMFEQQPIIRKYIDQLFERLHAEALQGTKPVDMVSWYNFTTFDIIGDLAFGESFGCLETSTYHPWIELIFGSIKYLAFAINLDRYPLITPALKLFIPRKLRTKMMEHSQLSELKVRRRLESKVDRPDFIAKITQEQKGRSISMSFKELVSNTSTLIIAGSETTATLLSAVTYFLATNTHVLTALNKEVRSSFLSEEEIDLVSTQKLPYMQAVLNEALRLFPPVPAASPRRIAEGGDNICGHFLPGGTVVEIWQWSLYHQPAFFQSPDEFIPERWLQGQQFASDRLDAVQPFSVGPRNCIGRK